MSVQTLLLKAQQAHQAGQLPQALDSLSQVLAQLPRAADVLNQRAIVYFLLGNLDAARQDWEQALVVDPENPSFWFNLGRCWRTYQALETHQRAQHCFQQALVYRPDYPQAWNSLGNLFTELGKPRAAIRAYQKALAGLAGQSSDLTVSIETNLAVAYLENHRPTLAQRSLQKLVQAHPDFALAQYNLGLFEMQQGKYKTGFARYDTFRWQGESHVRPLGNLSRPLWRGEACERLVICHERGFGDTLQCVRYLVAASHRVKHLFLEVPQALYELMHQLALPLACPLDIVLEGQPLPESEAWIPMMSLAALFAGTFAEEDAGDTGVQYIPYFEVPSADPPVVLSSGQGNAVGVVWSTGKRQAPQLHTLYRRRSVSPAHFTALQQAHPELSLYSFQVGEDDALPAGVQALPFALDTFADTARALQAMDLVITVDTAVAHLAGALDLPTWVLVPSVADWRWGFEGAHTPWYTPNMRVFRQKPEDSDWSGVFCELQSALAAF